MLQNHCRLQGNSEQLLEETASNVSASEELDSSQLKRSLKEHYAIIENLEEDKQKLNSIIEQFKTDKAIADDLVHHLEKMLDSKSNQIGNLKESLNLCNDKLSAMLKEDLEKNYKIIELEGSNEDFLRIQQEMKREIDHLKSTLEDVQKENDNLKKELIDTKLELQTEESKKEESREAFICDEVLRSNITMLENDANVLISQYRGARRNTSGDREKFRMVKLTNFHRSSKKKPRIEKSSESEELNEFLDSNFSNVSNSSMDKSQETAFQHSNSNSQPTLFRSSVRSYKKLKEESKRKPSLNILDRLKLVGSGGTKLFS